MRNLEQLLLAVSDRQLPPPARPRQLRQQAHLSRAEIATVVGVSVASITRWESGVFTPRGRTAEVYGDVLRRLAEINSSSP